MRNDTNNGSLDDDDDDKGEEWKKSSKPVNPSEQLVVRKRKIVEYEKYHQLLRTYIEEITPQIQGDLESRMFKEGHRNMMKEDVMIYHYLGSQIYNQLMMQSFEYTCEEFRYLGLEKRGEYFNKASIANKLQCLNIVISQLPYITKKSIKFIPEISQMLKSRVHRRLIHSTVNEYYKYIDMIYKAQMEHRLM